MKIDSLLNILIGFLSLIPITIVICYIKKIKTKRKMLLKMESFMSEKNNDKFVKKNNDFIKFIRSINGSEYYRDEIIKKLDIRSSYILCWWNDSFDQCEKKKMLKVEKVKENKDEIKKLVIEFLNNRD